MKKIVQDIFLLNLNSSQTVTKEVDCEVKIRKRIVDYTL